MIKGAIGNLGNANFSSLALKAYDPTLPANHLLKTHLLQNTMRQRYWITWCVIHLWEIGYASFYSTVAYLQCTYLESTG